MSEAQFVEARPGRGVERGRSGRWGAVGGATGARAQAAAATAVGYRISVGPGGALVRTRSEVPVTVTDGVALAGKPAAPGSRGATATKLAPKLVAALTDPAASKTQRVVVGFQNDMKIPQSPAQDPAQPRTSPANKATQARANTLIGSIGRPARPATRRSAPTSPSSASPRWTPSG